MRSEWMFAKKFILVTTISGVLAACSPARWHETKGQPPLPTLVPVPPVKPQEVPPSNQPPGSVTPPDRSKDCGHRFPGRDCEEEENYNDEDEFTGDEDTDSDFDENSGGNLPAPTPTPVPTPKPTPAPQKPVVPKQQNCCEVPAETEPCPPEAKVPVAGKPKRPKRDSDRRKVVQTIGPDTYFVVQNIATEKLRLYEMGRDGGPHKLILETDMVVGHDSDERRSILGEFEIRKWVKFYEDERAYYPSFFNPLYPELPGPGAPLSEWLSESLLPGKAGRIRGLYGWYAAILGPNADNHGMYGTWGWGADGDRIIRALRSSKWDNDLRVASRGGTRVENRAIALLRELLVPGSKVIKIYAREAYSRPESEILARGRIGSWPWALTADGVNEVDGSRAGRESVLARGVSPDMILDEGVYEFDQTPTAVPLTNAKNPHVSGNTYRIPKSSFKGVFLVDVGLTVNYSHPKELRVGGRPRKNLPAFMRAGNPERIYWPSGDRR